MEIKKRKCSRRLRDSPQSGCRQHNESSRISLWGGDVQAKRRYRANQDVRGRLSGTAYDADRRLCNRICGFRLCGLGLRPLECVCVRRLSPLLKEQRTRLVLRETIHRNMG